jgi:hypothetical protein
MISRLASFAAGAVITFLISVIAFVFAMGHALSWPLSDPNMAYALCEGRFWGVVGALVVGLGAAALKPNLIVCLKFIALASIVWAGLSSFCFFVFVAGTAGC